MCALTDAVFALLAVLALTLLVGTAASGDANSPTLLGRTLYVVRSGSMAPALGTGDVLLADTSVDADTVTGGDVIVFRSIASPSLLVSHRVLRTWETPDGIRWFTTKGDANSASDSGAVSENQLVAAMTSRIPKGGYVLEALRNTGAIAVLGLGSVLAHAALLIARSADSDGVRRRPRGTTQQKGIIR